MKMKVSLGPGTLAYPTPVFVVGTYDKTGKPNLMTAAWGGICCSKPPCVAIALREATYSYSNIMEQKAFTINIPSEDMVKEADYVGIVSGKTENKFETLGFTPVKSELVNAPYVDEFPFVLECKLLHILEIGRHTQFVGEILDAKVEPAVQASNNNPDPLKMKPFYFDPGTRGYYSTGKRIGDAFGIGKELKKESTFT